MSKINLKLLQTFLHAAESGSFRKAAEQSNRTPSAVSMQIKDLEERIGTSLFLRTPQRVNLTNEGRVLFEEIGFAMANVQASLDRLSDMAARRKGKIQIACAPSLASSRLGDILATFKLRHPGSVVEVQEAASKAALTLLHEQEVEFYIGPEVPNLNEFQFEPIIDDPLMGCIPEELFAGEATIAFEALARFPLILLNRKTAVRGLIDRLTRVEGIELKAQYEVESAQTAMALTSAGLGVSILPGIALGSCLDKRFRAVPLKNRLARRAVGIITNRGYVQQRYAEQLIALIRTKLRDQN
jgi:DNA-binding transcriptional LysR family regulator